MFGVTIAYPNTELFDWAVKNKVLTDRWWYMGEGSNLEVAPRNFMGNLNLKDFPIEEQVKMVREAYKSFYLRPKYVFKRLRAINNMNEFKGAIKSVKELFAKTSNT